MLFKLKSLSNHQKKNKVNPVPVRFLSVSWTKNKEKQEKVVNTQTSLFLSFPFSATKPIEGQSQQKIPCTEDRKSNSPHLACESSFRNPSPKLNQRENSAASQSCGADVAGDRILRQHQGRRGSQTPVSSSPLGTRKPVVAVTPAEKVTFRGGRPARRKSAVEYATAAEARRIETFLLHPLQSILLVA